MNKNKLTSTIHKISQEKNVSFNIILQLYFFESFLDRLSQSDYNNKFILKGGFLLSSILGIHQRSTLDMDFNIQDIIFTPENIEKVVLEIIRKKVHDDITYELIKVSDIMKQSRYNGYQVSLLGIFENIRVPFSIDIAFGDPITPKKIAYSYQSVVLSKNISIQAYNIETVLAEKLQTIIDKQTGNSRMKDFYDLYILNKLERKSIIINTLKDAILNTFQYRGTSFNKQEIKGLLEGMKLDQEFLKRWANYVKKNQYVDSLDFNDVIYEIFKLLEKL